MEKAVRTHKVGSITTGLSMIALRVELLLSNIISEKKVYDKTAIFLMFMVSLFAMRMAGAEFMMSLDV